MVRLELFSLFIFSCIVKGIHARVTGACSISPKAIGKCSHYLGSLIALEEPASLCSPLLERRTDIVYDCLSKIFSRQEDQVDSLNTSRLESCECVERPAAIALLENACLASDAFVFSQQQNLLLMLHREMLLLPQLQNLEVLHPANMPELSVVLENETARFVSELECHHGLSEGQRSFLSKIAALAEELISREVTTIHVGSVACGLGTLQSDLDLTILVR